MSTHHAYGTLVLLDDDDEAGGLLETTGCVVVNSYTLIHAELDGLDGSNQRIIGCQIAGQVNDTDDTISTVYLLSPSEAGSLVRGLTRAAEHLEPQDWAKFLLAIHEDDESSDLDED